MLTVWIPVLGIAYVIRIYSGRTHWASATLFGLLAWTCAFAFLVNFTQAETPVNISFAAAVVGAAVLTLPAGWLPGVTEENKSLDDSEGRNDGKYTSHGDNTRPSDPSTSDLPKSVVDKAATNQQSEESVLSQNEEVRRVALEMVVVLLLVVGLVLGKLFTDSPVKETVSAKTDTSKTVTSDTAMFKGKAARSGVYAGPGPDAPIKAKWTVEITSASKPSSSPMVVDGTVYFGTSNLLIQESHGVYALNAETGEGQWHFETDGSVRNSPAVAGGTVYVGTSAGHVYALNAETGEGQWRFEVGEHVNTSPAVLGGTVYVGNSAGAIYALSAEAGRQQWRFDTYSSYPVPATGVVVSPPAAVGGTVYVGAGGSETGPSAFVYALNAETGQEQWRSKLGNDVLSTSLAVNKGTVYVATSTGIATDDLGTGSHENYVYALNTETGLQQWRFEANGRTFRSLSVAHESVYVGSAGQDGDFVYSLEAESARQQWRFRTGEAAEPVVAGNTVYVGGGDQIYALDAKTGRNEWNFGVNLSTAPVVLGGTVYVASASGYVYALE